MLNKNIIWFIACLVLGLILGAIASGFNVSAFPLILAYGLGIISQILARIILE